MITAINRPGISKENIRDFRKEALHRSLRRSLEVAREIPHALAALPSRLKRPYLEILADYGGSGDTAFSEVTNYIEGTRRLQRLPTYSRTSVHFPSTIETGFQIAQLATYGRLRPDNYVVFSNTAPRGTKPGHTQWLGGDGTQQEFAYAKLRNGVVVFGVNIGNAFSFIKDDIVDFRRVNVSNNTHSFRSREQYAPAVADYLKGGYWRKQVLGERLDVSSIPDLPRDVVVYKDRGYDDLKLSIRKDDFLARPDTAKSKFLKVTINGITHQVRNTLVEGNEGETGQLCLVVGSSGGNTENRFLELIVLTGIGENTPAKKYKYAELYDEDRGVIIEPCTEQEATDFAASKTPVEV